MTAKPVKPKECPEICSRCGMFYKAPFYQTDLCEDCRVDEEWEVISAELP
jgi:hypothetical protein